MDNAWIYDRRQSMRILEHLSASIICREPSNGLQVQSDGMVTTLSEGGLSVKLATDLAAVPFMSINFKLPNYPDMLSFKGKIIYRNDKDKTYHIEFVNLTRESERVLASYLNDQTNSLKKAPERRNGSTSERRSQAKDRQGKPRFTQINSVKASVVNSKGTQIGQITLINLGQTGMCVICPVKLLDSEMLKVKLERNDDQSQLDLRAQVRWIQKMDQKGYMAGLEIAHTSGSQENLDNWLSRLAQETYFVDRRVDQFERRKETILSRSVKRGDFVYVKTVYLSDTNAFGNTYFAQYVQWQGIVREAWLRTVPGYEKLFTMGIKLITVEVHMKYKGETRLFDDIEIYLHIGAVKRTSFEFLFTYRKKKTKQLVGEGSQTIGFADPKGKLIEIPQVLKDGLRPYMSYHSKLPAGTRIPTGYKP